MSAYLADSLKSTASSPKSGLEHNVHNIKLLHEKNIVKLHMQQIYFSVHASPVSIAMGADLILVKNFRCFQEFCRLNGL